MEERVDRTAGEPAASDRVLTIPNAISAVRLGMVPAFLWAFLAGSHPIALVLLALIGGSDWVDGFVARRTGQVSVLGKLLDPLADRIAIVVALVAFAVRGTIPLVLAALIVARDVIVLAAFWALESRGVPRIPVNRVGKAATAAIFTGTAFAVGALVLGPSGGGAAKLASTGLLVAGAVLYYVAGGMYAAEVWRRMRPPGG